MITLVATIVAMLVAAPATAPSAPPAPAPRAARSVHLRYPADECDVFYNEMTVTRSTPGSYFMACGFTGGYFGIQELVDGKKVAIFSVWDPTKGDEQANVPADQRVTVVYDNPKARIKRFGGEGTGAQCIIDFDWSIDEAVCFAIRAKVVEDRTQYSSYIRPKKSNEWQHLATFATLNKGKRLTGLYSFIEDFRRDTTSANESRRAMFANGWVLSNENWNRLTSAQFTASRSEWEAKDTIDAGKSGESFFLQTGGDTKQHLKLGDTIKGEAAYGAQPPELPSNN